MTFLERKIKNLGRHFSAGKPLAKFYPVYEALDTFCFTPGTRTSKAPFVRDAIDLKRVMTFVVLGLMPCLAMGIYNTGYQVLLARGEALRFGACVWQGLFKVFPVILVAYAAGGFWEVLFAAVRKHEISEGFLVTGLLCALIMPPTVPLWQVAVGISFGVVIGKEIFGGTGYNIFNPALVSRAFLFFAYPAQFSGDQAWVAVDGFSRATPLAVLSAAGHGGQAVPALQEAGYSFSNMFWGFIPGSIGETSTFACLLGMGFLLVTGVANWRVIAGCGLGLLGTGTLLFFSRGPESLAFFSLPPHWHLVMGGFAFGSIFMATDPVSSCATNSGRWIFGLLVGTLVVLIRVFNPAYPEGVMLAIIFMNAFAPLVDHYVVERHIRKRSARLAAFRGEAGCR
ncbi:MAG TPA: NADH:ubiquinone reductase (Na(+)-transporting) subunit B [Candidatus Omnitrophota bacterium]|nr:NADH:ubiquinone reductase (Na(+)-transporting) subunit B [Candidatus Omnitrophota bacterium]